MAWYTFQVEGMQRHLFAVDLLVIIRQHSADYKICFLAGQSCVHLLGETSDFCPRDDPLVVMSEARTSANPGAPSSFQASFWNALWEKNQEALEDLVFLWSQTPKNCAAKREYKSCGGKQFSENRLNSNNLFTLLCYCDGTTSDTVVWCWIESSVSGCFLSLTLRSHSYFLSAFIHFYFWKTTSEEHLCYVPWNIHIKFSVWGNFRIISVARNLLKACYLSKFSSL